MSNIVALQGGLQSHLFISLPSNLNNRCLNVWSFKSVKWVKPFKHITSATVTSHYLFFDSKDFQAMRAVTRLTTDTVRKRHLAAGNKKQIKPVPGWSVWSLCGAVNVGRQQGTRGEAGVFHLLENQTESHWFSHDIPNPPRTRPFRVRRLTWRTCTPSYIQTHSSKPDPPTPHPTSTQQPPPLPLCLPGCFPLLAPLLIYVFAEQLLPRELREQHSHLSTLVTRCHLFLPAHRTSRETMPHAFWTSDLQHLL